MMAEGQVRTGPVIEFDGQSSVIAPADPKLVSPPYHAIQKFWIINHSPKLA